MQHIVPVSGGKDSTALALRLQEIEPRPYQYVITPTGDELPEMIDHWKNLGEMLGSPIKVISSGQSLQGLIRRWGALPNWRQRWCTRVLKIEPFNEYLWEVAPATVYVGLRADEEGRVGNMLYGKVEGITQRYPLQEWGWDVNDVLGFLEKRGVTIPKRTDCSRCFFQRLGEWWELWAKNPDAYASAEKDEKATGHTFRSPGRDSWPAGLAEMRQKFEKGKYPRGAGQLEMFSDRRPDMCRVCSL